MSDIIKEILQREVATLGVEKPTRENVNSSTFRYTQKMDIDVNNVVAEIGDRDKSSFYPCLKISKWNNECYFKIKAKEDVGKNPVFNEDKTEWIDNKREYHFYPLGPEAVGFEKWYEPFIKQRRGGFEFETILKEKPSSNKLEFDIETKGLRFLYQPILTSEERDLMEIEGEIVRPEFIEGSYAIYKEEDKNAYNNKQEAEKYKCGKFGHIYRPQMEDSNGWKVWGELQIENNIMRIIIPQDFIDDAVYPIKHAGGSTFGYEVSGGSNRDISHTFVAGAFFTCPEAGNAGSIKASLYHQANETGMKYIYGFYRKSDSVYVDKTAEGTISGNTSNTFIELTFSGSPPLTNQDYILVARCDATGSTNTVFIQYETESNKGRYYQQTYGSWDDPASFTTDNYKCSIYCVYEAGASGPAVKSVNGVAYASVKSINGVANASIKSVNGIT